MQVESLENMSIRFIKGVGPRKAELFKNLGIETIMDLFYYLPRRYEDRSHIVRIKDLRPDMSACFIGKVLKTNIFTAKTGTCIFEAVLCDFKDGGYGNWKIHAVWYNQPFIKKVFSVGSVVMLYGKCELRKHLQMTHPAYEVIEDLSHLASLDVRDQAKLPAAVLLDLGRIVPIYPLTENITERYLRKVVWEALDLHLDEVCDILPTRIRARERLVDLRFALKNIHFPSSFENLGKAHRRLVFEEFFILQLAMAERRKKISVMGIKHEAREGLLDEFEKLFSFDLTSEQKKCIKEIESDMLSPNPMYRLLQGDVGSGKTVVSMYALLFSIKNGYEAAVMVPTAILARQHYVTISKYFMPLGLNIRLLVGDMDEENKSEIKKELAQGTLDVIIGTHSLIQEDIKFNNLGFVVIDEQHKFGVDQRKMLCQKANRMPDTLMMTATPIPRSLALTIFGDMDISLLKEKPEGREEVTTYWVGEDRREAVYAFLRSEIAKGHQAFIVYPRIKASLSTNLKAIDEMHSLLQNKIFSDLRVGLIHGKMKTSEKEKVMAEFREGKLSILVASTVIEVGIDVENVTVMLVEHAERYGMAQLHQLRGRIGRGRHSSFCILIGSGGIDASHERLSVMALTNNGFELSERDLEIRGPGEFFGTRQSGLPELKIGDIAKDLKVMEEARVEAFNLVEEDPELVDPHNARVKETLATRFKPCE